MHFRFSSALDSSGSGDGSSSAVVALTFRKERFFEGGGWSVPVGRQYAERSIVVLAWAVFHPSQERARVK